MTLDDAAEAIERVLTAADPRDDVSVFLHGLAHAKRAGTEVSATDWARFLDRTTEPVRDAHLALDSHLAHFEGWLPREFFEDDWRAACERRRQEHR